MTDDELTRLSDKVRAARQTGRYAMGEVSHEVSPMLEKRNGVAGKEMPVVLGDFTMKSLLARPDEVRAFLAGRKTMFRRPIKMREFGTTATPGYDWHFRDRHACWNDVSTARLHELLPYAPGDTVAVKETWASGDEMAFSSAQDPPQCIAYRADKTAVIFGEDLKPRQADSSNWSWEHSCLKWKSPSHLPLWAVRLHLLVKEVKVERLQAISITDARDEGVEPINEGNPWFPLLHYRKAFWEHWDSHAKPGERWADNPFVVAYTVEVKHV